MVRVIEIRSRSSVEVAAPPRFRHAVVVTTLLVYLTVLLGVSTRAAGAGLACNANWPLCDGGLLNLFPATVPSAFEWVHRVVAGVTGIAMLGTAALAWRWHVGRRPRWAVTIGTALLPLQVLLGRETVVSFTPPVLALHYWTAMAIYGAFALATITAWRESLGVRHVRAALAGAVALVPAVVLLGPPLVVRYSPPVQALQYAVILLLFAALVLAAAVGRTLIEGRAFGAATVAAAALAPAVVYLGRQRIVHPTPAFETTHVVATAALFVAVLAAAGLALRGGPAGGE